VILVPLTSRRSNNPPEDTAADVEQERAASGFKPGYVFDVSQTDAEPLPAFAEVSGERQATISTR
jgi:hypothetical protein